MTARQTPSKERRNRARQGLCRPLRGSSVETRCRWCSIRSKSSSTFFFSISKLYVVVYRMKGESLERARSFIFNIFEGGKRFLFPSFLSL